jgi:hypothetical protein
MKNQMTTAFSQRKKKVAQHYRIPLFKIQNFIHFLVLFHSDAGRSALVVFLFERLVPNQQREKKSS